MEPELLLHKLKIYDLEGDFLSWIESYLTNRQKAVWLDHVLSGFQNSDVGVQEGSNLGPLFFLIFYNDLPYSLECDVDAYADDSTMSHTDKDILSIGDKLSESCRKVSLWMRENRLKLNADKTHLITVGTRLIVFQKS